MIGASASSDDLEEEGGLGGSAARKALQGAEERQPTDGGAVGRIQRL